MRILIIHNYYQDPGGEDAVFEQERALLATTETVETLTFRNQKGWRGAWQTLWSPWNTWAGRRVKQAIRTFSPDVIHIHNLHYAIGPIAIRIAKRHGIPVVMTLHNYRLLCPSATLFHAGKLFLDSLHAGFPWKAVRLGVHSNSVFKTYWLAFTVWLHKLLGTWCMVDRYIVLTDFARQLFVDSSFGVPATQFVVKPNFVADTSQLAAVRGRHFLFIGRLTQEKGIKVLLEAFGGTELHVRIVGDGPLRTSVVDAAQQSANITYLGTLGRGGIEAQLASCTALIFPSVWYEGMPMTVIEAFASGTPVIASNLGAMQSMIHDGQNGQLYTPGDAAALRRETQRWLSSEDAYRQQVSDGAREAYEQRYTAHQNHTLLLDIYRLATFG
ncbi:glycosyltransferase [Parapedobacter sp. DT-150]|uniref:glycosyltransferase n=1 Tax=Parapedobacter sp. DT-150 TaxID=3396162 RepID=UPI003F1E3089